MRTLLYVPIIHMEADLGSLASAVANRGIMGLGEEIWIRHKETVSGFWGRLIEYFDRLNVKGFRIYQDGMVANDEMAMKIVEEGLKSGSKNYELVHKLIKNGATLIKTEDFALLLKERNSLKQLTAKGRKERLIAYMKYKLIKNNLLEKRDRFIAQRINETLKDTETGISFIGAYHNVIPFLDKDIHVKEIKELKKVRDYQRTLLHAQKDTEGFEALSTYLIKPISV